MMVVFECISVRSVDPFRRPQMVGLGYRVHVEPDKYPGHKLIHVRLTASPHWRVVVENTEKVAEPIAVESDGLLPHQRDVLAKLGRSKS